MDAHVLGSGNAKSGLDNRPHRHSSCTQSARSKLYDLEGYSSEDEVESLLSPSWYDYPSRRHRRNHFTSSESDDLSDTSVESIHTGRKVTFALTQSAGRPATSSQTTISGGHQSSVGGSQNIIADHRYRQTDVTNYYGPVIQIHVDSKGWVISIGLFGRGDSMTMRCT